MANFIVVAIIVVIVGLAARHIYMEKKRGVKCIGCPEGCSCSSCGCCGRAGCCGEKSEN